VANFQPFEQYAGIVQAQPDAWMLEEGLRKGQVTLLISFFNNVVEVPYRLMRMDHESKEDFIQGLDSFHRPGRDLMPAWRRPSGRHLLAQRSALPGELRQSPRPTMASTPFRIR